MERRIRWSGIVGVLGALAAGLLALTPFGERLELRTHDMRFELRGPRRTRARIVIAEIADSTLAAWPDEPMTAWGAHFAAAIGNARRLGASWIGLDVILAGPVDPASDRSLARALMEGHVVLANSRPAGRQPINPRPSLLYAHPEQTLNLGFVDARWELDQVIRHAAVFDRDAGALVPSFAAVLALRLRGEAPTEARAVRSLADSASPEAADGTIWINYAGPPCNSPDAPAASSRPPPPFPCLAIETLAEGKLTAEEQGWLRDAVVLIGPTYSGSNDDALGPAGAVYHGIEVHAHTLATLLDGRPLRRSALGREALLTTALGAGLALTLPFLPFGWGLFVVTAAGITWALAAGRAFGSDALWPVAGPLMALGLSWIGHNSAVVVEEARRRRWIQGVFGRYVSAEIVEYLLQNPEHLAMSGVECEASVLFVDIRGHTTASERRAPAEVLAEANAFFGEVVPVVDHWGGHILQYMGDGFMAVFGAPRTLKNHAQSAVEAAMEIVRVSRRQSARRRAQGDAPLRIGCSVHSGRVVCGNLGGAERSQYSVMGDTSNVAARLEELNKVLGSEMVISAATRELLDRAPETEGPHSFDIRGREGRVSVYQVRFTDEE